LRYGINVLKQSPCPTLIAVVHDLLRGKQLYIKMLGPNLNNDADLLYAHYRFGRPSL